MASKTRFSRRFDNFYYYVIFKYVRMSESMDAIHTSVLIGSIIALVSVVYLAYEGYFSSELTATATSAVLVLVTIYYAIQTRRNVELLDTRHSREKRRYHTEVLRKYIVDEWLAALPTVKRTEINPAPSKHEFQILGVTPEFRVVPEVLEGNPYLDDFLQNHAKDVNKIKEDLEELHKRFVEIRDTFYEEYDNIQPVEDLPFRIETTNFFEEWAFERILLLERSIKNKEQLHNDIEKGIKNDKLHQQPPLKRYPGDNTPSHTRYILKCWVLEEDEYGDTVTSPSNADELVIDALKQVINRLEECEEYTLGRRAAEVLDEAEKSCQKLQNSLIKYSGMEVYRGDCEYLEYLH